MWCNGLLCGPGLFICAILSGELDAVTKYEHLFKVDFLLVVGLSFISAFILNYSLFMNTIINSPLTQVVCGNTKDVFTILVGFIIDSSPKSIWNVLGVCVSASGSFLYAYLTFRA